MEIIFCFAIGAVTGILITWQISQSKWKRTIQAEREAGIHKYNELERLHIALRANSETQLLAYQRNLDEKNKELTDLSEIIRIKYNDLSLVNHQLSTATANLQTAHQSIRDRDRELDEAKQELRILKQQLDEMNQQLVISRAGSDAMDERFRQLSNEAAILKEDLHLANNQLTEKNQELATSLARNISLQEKLEREKKEIEELGKKFNTEFENIANKILETKTEKFTELNKNNLKDILDPLGMNINEFKKKVEDVYEKESKERFSLGEKVKELALLNQVISQEARNLTRALKGESKTQGRWGEMILESILEKSGLVKGREYFMEHELTGEDGKTLKSDLEGKKMRPDAVIRYPDNRSVIIDSKVSLNAFTRLTEASDPEEQKKELNAHILAIKNHITSLSAKGYDDYNHALDFVMLFVPSEAAYNAALQGDPNLWNFAYDKRILLLSPTNLITSLKLIVDLWKREYQNKNAQKIAKAGADLYDKFVGFVANLRKVGDHLNSAQDKFNESYKQLCTGNGNLLRQTAELKSLGLKTKKELPQELVNIAFEEDLSQILEKNSQ
ncbi:DNA recombination protein RmuC [Desertivirga xinjiangensis]|uniref:DNA recombination protein RmuC n=1 Tax=Desertivirga xinjiangensis TaxID=539206 RepID=UPI002109C27B|nr:DNA recombination protein RmuC [Pedobacter xinjiangensis]